MSIRKDWEVLKRDFLDSKFVDVRSWGRQKEGLEAVVDSGHFARKTKGWATEKSALAKKETEMTVQKVLEARSSSMANALGDVYDHLVKNKDVYMAESAKGLETVWKILMVANGQATSISKNDNTNYNTQSEGVAMAELLKAAQDAKGKRKKK